MRLIACTDCHTQYDVADVSAPTLACRCGRKLCTDPPEPVEAGIHRCGSCGALVEAEAGDCLYCGSEIVREDDALSLVCPECFARCADDARFCTGCGVAFTPATLEIEGVELPCPVCTTLMPPSAVGGLGINECRSCHGLWVPDDGFEHLVARAVEGTETNPNAVAGIGASPPRVAGANPARQSVQYRKCPTCDGFMLRRNYRKRSGIILDVCNDHGTWLDADELEAIAGFIQSGAATAAAAKGAPDAEAQRRAGQAFVRRSAQHPGARAPASWGAPDLSGPSKPGVASTLLDLLVKILN